MTNKIRKRGIGGQPFLRGGQAASAVLTPIAIIRSLAESARGDPQNTKLQIQSSLNVECPDVDLIIHLKDLKHEMFFACFCMFLRCFRFALSKQNVGRCLHVQCRIFRKQEMNILRSANVTYLKNPCSVD